MPRTLGGTVVAVFVLAAALRISAAVAISLLVDGGLVPDERMWWRLGREFAAGESGGWSRHSEIIYGAAPGFVRFLAGVDLLTRGAGLLAPRIAIALTGAAVAALTTVVGAMAAGRRAGLIAGLLVAVWPSQVVFSSLVLKDPMTWLLLVGLALLLASGLRADRRGLILLGAVGVLALVLAVVTMRWSTGLVVAGLVVPAVLVYPRPSRLVAVPAGVMVCVIGLAVVVGPRLLPERTGGPAGGGVPSASEYADAVAQQADRRHESTAVGACTALEPISPSGGITGMVRRLPRGASAVLLGPTPWNQPCSMLGRAAQVETVVWYGVLGLAVAGAWRIRDWRVLVFPVLLSAVLVAGYAVGDGNVGTAFRHRGEFTWVVMIFAGAALAAIGTRGSGQAPADG